jgi:hypothetical protein
VLISTVDVITDPTSLYGQNRLLLENFIKTNFDHVILRLCTFIGQHIKKNMLFDLKHNVYINQIDMGAKIQWCILDDLPRLIKNSLINSQINVVSVPIENQEISDEFFPSVQLSKQSNNKCYNISPYLYNRSQIFAAIREYLK